MADLSSKKVLVLVSNRGAEQDELTSPVESLRSAGANVKVAAPRKEKIQTLVGDWDQGKILEADMALETVNEQEFDLLLIPGGTLNADNLRLDDEAQRIVQSFAATGRPVASICHGPWLLVETGLVRDKTLTSYKSIRQTWSTLADSGWTRKFSGARRKISFSSLRATLEIWKRSMPRSSRSSVLNRPWTTNASKV